MDVFNIWRKRDHHCLSSYFLLQRWKLESFARNVAGQVVHVLDFYLSFGNYTFLDEEDDDLKELKAFYVELKYVKGRLDKDISLK